MATNDFLPFATASGANVVSQATYAGLPAISTGYQSGVAQSAQLNKTWRQSSIMSAVLAQFISDRTGANATDDGTTATLLANLKLSAAALNGDASQTFNVAPATASSNAVQFGQVSGLVGSARNLKIIVASVSSSTTVTADEIIVETALGGLRYCLGPYSQTVNLATVGAGGMDVGTAPSSGYVALYAIYGPTVGQSILAVNATSSAAPSIYAGAHMPANYTASALISVFPTTAGGQFTASCQFDRTVFCPVVTALSISVQQASYTSLSITSAVPPNAKTAGGYLNISSTTSATCLGQISGNAAGVGAMQSSAANDTAGQFSVPMPTSQTIYYTATITAGTISATIGITSYTF